MVVVLLTLILVVLIGGIKIMADNVSATQALVDLVNNEIVPILQDLASKVSSNPADVSASLTNLAASLKAAAESADPSFQVPATPAKQ